MLQNIKSISTWRALGFAFLFCVALQAFAQHNARFTVAREGQTRSASVEVIERNGNPYCSLARLATDLGGGFRIEAGRAQVDFAGRSAWVPLGGTQVDSSFSRFELSHPVIRYGDDALVVPSDAQRLWSNAFRVDMTVSLPQYQSEENAAAPPSDARRVTVENLMEDVTVSSQLVGAGAGLRTILLDPGHGGIDLGAEGAQGLREKDITVAMCKAMKPILEDRLGVTVHLTRDTDEALSVAERREMVVRTQADLLISIHTGASLAPSARGLDVYHPVVAETDESVTRLAAALAGIIGESIREKPDMELRNVHPVPCALFQYLPVPAVLIEAGCLTNVGDAEALTRAAYHRDVADFIAVAVARYVEATTDSTSVNRSSRQE